MRSTSTPPRRPLLLSSAALAQSHVRLSYELASPAARPRASSTQLQQPRRAPRCLARGLLRLPLRALGRPEQLQRREAWACSPPPTGQDVYGKQFRYLNVVPLMAGFAFHVPLGHGSRFWAGCNGGVGYFDRVIDLGPDLVLAAPSWQWGIQPQVGIAFGLGGGTALFFDGRYNYFWAKDGWPTQAVLVLRRRPAVRRLRQGPQEVTATREEGMTLSAMAVLRPDSRGQRRRRRLPSLTRMGWVRRTAGLLSAVLLPLPGAAAATADLPEIRARGTSPGAGRRGRGRPAHLPRRDAGGAGPRASPRTSPAGRG